MEQAYPDFSRMKTWHAPDGTAWHRRGDRVLEDGALSKRLRQPGITALHYYLGELSEIPAPERESFWGEAEQRMAASGYAGFRGFEFRSDAGDLLLVIDETC